MVDLSIKIFVIYNMIDFKEEEKNFYCSECGHKSMVFLELLDKKVSFRCETCNLYQCFQLTLFNTEIDICNRLKKPLLTISKLITELQAIYEDFGDLNVFWTDSEGGDGYFTRDVVVKHNFVYFK
jgi:transcription elongation factor Elf1